MTPDTSQVLDLFIIMKDGGGLAHASELSLIANQILERYEPSYADLTCEEVLDRIESEFSQSDYDLAILCFEAISYIATHYPEVI